MKHFAFLALLVLCLVVTECHSKRHHHRRHVQNYGYGEHLLGSLYGDYFGGNHGKHGHRLRRHHGGQDYGFGLDPWAYLGYAFGDYYPYHHQGGRGLRHRRHKHGRRHGYGYY